MQLPSILAPLFNNNQFATGGLALMAVGSIGALLRKVPARVFKFVEARFSVTIDVSNTDQAFEWVTLWLDAHPYSRRTKRLSVQTKRLGRGSIPSALADDDDEVQDGQRVMLTPAPGDHFFMYRGRMVWLTRNRSDDAKAAGATTLSPAKESYTIQIVGRSQAIARALIEDARQLAMRQQQRQARIYVSGQGYWSQIGTVASRPLESVVLPAGQKEAVLADLEKFLGGRQWYRERGVPYRRGYLFHGLPGTGKSSLVAALAGKLGLSLYVLNIGSITSDDRLTELLADVRDRSILLLEDIDAATRNRETPKGEDEKKDYTGVTMSGLLNALDGVTAREGALVFFTTNYRDRLDSALIRPGRADTHVEFRAATAAQGAEMYARFFPAAPVAAAESFGRAAEQAANVMADIQQVLIQYAEDGPGALAAMVDRANGASA